MTKVRKLIIGNKNYSSWSLRPWVLLKHTGLTFEEEIIPLYRENTAALIRAYNPAGKVPILVEDDLHIADSLAIAEYLAETYPQCKLWPDDCRARALARSVSAEMHSGFFGMREELSMNCRARYLDTEFSAKAQADIDRVKQIWSDCRSQFASAGPWLFGHFTIADAMFAPVAFRFQTYGVVLEGLPRAYCDTLLGDAAMGEWYAAALVERERIEQYER